MMRGVSNWAVAVRKPTAEQLSEGGRAVGQAAEGEIEVTSFPLDSALSRHRVLRLPIIRGVVALGGSLVIGFRALEVSANAQLGPAEGEPEGEQGQGEGVEPEQEEIPRAVWAGTVVVAVVLAIVLFFLIPVGLTSLIKGPARLLGAVLAGRGPRANGHLPRLHAAALARAQTCGACSSTTAPSTRRSPASRRDCR